MRTLFAPLHSFLDLLYPPLCEACGRVLVKGEHLICMTCLYELPLTGFWTERDNAAARLFWGKVDIEQASSFFYFSRESRYRRLMHRIKYEGKKELGVMLGRRYGRELARSPLYTTVDVVVPLPLHVKRLRKRGYNQSALIAEGIAAAMQKPMLPNALQRATYTESQTSKNRVERWKNVENVFCVPNPAILNGKHILLVDDILTTGATLEACALSILQSTSCKVSIASLGIAVY